MNKLSTTDKKMSELAIRKVFEDGCAAWNRGDLDSYLAFYWDSDTIKWISGGILTRGRKAIVADYKARFSTAQQMGKLTLAELEIEVLTAADAIASGRWILVIEARAAKGFFTVQLRKIEGNWLFVYDHSSTNE